MSGPVEPAGLEDIPQRLPVHQFHHDELLSVAAPHIGSRRVGVTNSIAVRRITIVSMNRLPCLVVFAAAAAFGQAGTGFGGQVFRKAPPHIDEALKARIDTFYNLHMEGKFRQADAIVHEDSKDIFFEAEKVRMRGFKLVTINYEDDFNRAKVVVDLDTEFYFVGFGKMDVHRPLTSTWKRDSGGSWWW